MIRAFTGPSHLTTPQAGYLARDVRGLPEAAEVRTGAATGADTIAALVSLGALPAARHVIYLPGAPNNGHNLPEQIERIQCPQLHNRGASYRRRNEMMCRGAHVLVAYVTSPNFYRSGEWMTINIARRFGLDVVMRVLP